MYPGNPYYIYCDMISGHYTIRQRFLGFGYGLGVNGPVTQFECNDFQLSWKIKAIGFCTFTQLCVTAPVFRSTGSISVSLNSPISAEILFAGTWYRIPDRLWLT